VQACLGTLLQLDEHAGTGGAEGFPLAEYAAQHWVERAQFEQVSSRVRDGMDDLFDSSKPHLAAWLQVHDVDEDWTNFSPGGRPAHGGSPLYYAAFCGFYDLAERLIMKDPEQVNAGGGRILAPLPAALYRRHFRVASLLRKHGAVVDVRGDAEWTPLHTATASEHIDIMRWLLNNGADPNSRSDRSRTPLHVAAYFKHLDAVQVLLEHNADANLQDVTGGTPLYDALARFGSSPGEVVSITRQLLKHGADTNICVHHSTPLHIASSHGWLEVVQLLLSYGAKVDEKDEKGKTPFQVASEEGYDEITKVLLEHGAVP